MKNCSVSKRLSKCCQIGFKTNTNSKISVAPIARIMYPCSRTQSNLIEKSEPLAFSNNVIMLDLEHAKKTPPQHKNPIYLA